MSSRLVEIRQVTCPECLQDVFVSQYDSELESCYDCMEDDEIFDMYEEEEEPPAQGQ